ncbi:MAG: hypothetical protein IJ183_03245 [Prevotella sp.]|nr:hypothetical protein [Prevotella sp.]
MKKIITILFLAACMNASAQNYKNDGKPYAFYCQLVGHENIAGQLRVEILWNNKKGEHNLRTEDGKKIEFQSMVDGMNYMSKRGWDYVECVTYSHGGINVVHYIFRKFVTNDYEAKEGLYFKEDFNK